MFKGAKDILQEFPQTCPKNFCAANFPLQILCSSWLLIINSQILKHEFF